MTRHLKEQLNDESGFTLIELVLVITLVGILAVTAAAPGFGIIGDEAQNTQRDGTVAAVRDGINFQYSFNLVTTGAPIYPVALDAAANGDCLSVNPCFNGVLKDSITAAWQKNGVIYTHAATGTSFTYDDTTGTFE